MNSLENQMIKLLIDLKENYYAIGVKAEFEEEGASFQEAFCLKEIVVNAGLDLTIKIGGCGALNDIREARKLGANAVVAPMIESPYAMKKYIKIIKSVFSENDRKDLDVLINIETITGYTNLDEMLQQEEAYDLTGIVLGRADMTGSMGLTRDDINSKENLEIANNLALKTSKYNKKFIIGGGVSARSIKFFRELPKSLLHKFETRKIIFDAQKALASENIGEGILKAIEFERMWIKNKRDFYGVMHDQDIQRLITLDNCYKKSLESSYEVCKR